MTSIQDPPLPPGDTLRHPVLRLVDSLTRGLDAVTDTPVWAMSAAEQREALLAIRRQRGRLQELELRTLTAAHQNGVGEEFGATSTAAWLAHATRTTRAAAFRDLHLAEALEEGFDATRRAMSAGTIDAEKAGVIVQAVSSLTDEYDDLPAGTHVRAETHLLELAEEHDAPTLRRLAHRLIEVVCPEAADEAEGRKLEEEEKRARRLATLSTRDNGDGTVDGRFRLPHPGGRTDLDRGIPLFPPQSRSELRDISEPGGSHGPPGPAKDPVGRWWNRGRDP